MILAALTSLALAQSNSVTGMGIFCTLFEINDSGEFIDRKKHVDLNILLSGHIANPNGRAILKTIDPGNVLGGGKFEKVLVNEKEDAKSYGLTSDKSAGSPGYLLMIRPLQIGGEFDAMFGSLDNSKGQRRGGRCFGPVGPMDEAAFDAEGKQ